MRKTRSVLALSAILIVGAVALVAHAASNFAMPKKGGEEVIVKATPFVLDPTAPARKIFGKLQWRGGLVLSSPAKFFGGLSGLDFIDRKGRKLVAVTDTGAWLMGELVYRNGVPVGLDDVRMGPLLGRNGKRFYKKRYIDAEAIDVLPGQDANKRVLIAFERRHRIGYFPLREKAIGAAIRYVPLPKGLRKAKKNKGIEAMARLEVGPLKGTILAFAERKTDRKGRLKGWLIGGEMPGELKLVDHGGFNITDLAELPNGDVVLLERRFRLTEGVKMRLRRIAQKKIRPEAVLDGEVLFEAGPELQIDNMEGLSVHTDDNGKIVLTLISDDNFQFMQRTLLMQFSLMD